MAWPPTFTNFFFFSSSNLDIKSAALLFSAKSELLKIFEWLDKEEQIYAFLEEEQHILTRSAQWDPNLLFFLRKRAPSFSLGAYIDRLSVYVEDLIRPLLFNDLSGPRFFSIADLIFCYFWRERKGEKVILLFSRI